MINITDFNTGKIESIKKEDFQNILPIQKEFNEFILNEINSSKNNLDIIKNLYLTLNKTLNYDAIVIYYTNIVRKYINKTFGVEELGFENNRINCRSWSYLFCYYLRLLDIDAKILFFNNHMSVEIKTENGVIIADATNSITRDLVYMSDMGRTKYGFEERDLAYVNGEELLKGNNNHDNFNLIDINLLKEMEIEEIFNYMMELEKKCLKVNNVSSLEKLCFYKTIFNKIKKDLTCLSDVTLSTNLFKNTNDGFDMVTCFNKKNNNNLFNGDSYILDKNKVEHIDANMLRQLLKESIYLYTPNKNEVYDKDFKIFTKKL